MKKENFGYDTAVISGTTSIVATQFGLDTIQLGWYVGCALIGSIAGVASAGVISDRIGRKKAMLFAAFMFSISACLHHLRAFIPPTVSIPGNY